MKTALVYQNKLNSFIQVMLNFVRGRGMGYWKAALTLLGYDMGYTVFPSTPVADADLQELKEQLTKINFFNEML